jgi:hypothetical protein
MKAKSIGLPRMLVIVILAAIYSLGFIITPYWMRAKTTPEMVLVLVCTIAIGAIWVVFSAKDLVIQLKPIHWGFFLILLAGLVLLNIRLLTVNLPWRGDEDIHITRTLALASTTAGLIELVFGFVLLVTLALAWKKSKWAVLPGIAFLAGVIAYYLAKNPLSGITTSILLRYPYINYWFFAIAPMAAMAVKTNPYQEAFFRIVPFLCTFLLVWVFQSFLSGSKTYLNILWGLAAATIPLVYYYSSILYLELPTVVLMLVVCLNIRSLLKDDFQAIRQNPAWYALILVGFIKETTLPFLIGFIGWRLIVQVAQGRISLGKLKLSLRNLWEEARIALALLLPIVFFLFLRGRLSQQSREFSFHLANLGKPVVYATIFKSFYQQFGLLPGLLFVGSCIFLVFFKKEYSQTGFFISLVFLYPLFFAVDTLIYTGYSRFNLFVLPAVLAGVAILIRELMMYKKIIAAIAACAILVVNFWTSPVNLDGSKKPLWGNYLTDTSEHYYPYRAALEWLKTNNGQNPILFAGMYYPYDFDFYFGQLDWKPIYFPELMAKYLYSNSLNLSQAVAEADTDQINIILFQVLGNNKTAVIPVVGSFHEEKTFINEAHVLVVYRRQP